MLEELRQYAKENFVPIIREKSGGILSGLCLENKPKRILEIGTAIGYSGILMLVASPYSRLTTIEKNEQLASLAESNFYNAGFSENIRIIKGDAAEELPKLVKYREKFDFIFLDGPKAQYYRYLSYLKELLNVGGILFADDVYFYGLVKGDEVPAKKRSIVRNLRLFINALEEDEDFDTKFLDIEDGISISKKIR